MRLSIEVIVNASAGSFVESETHQLLIDEFAKQDVEAIFHFAKDGAEIERFVEAAAAGDADVIVAGGGDGTISGVAEEVYRSGKTLGVLPLGTLNNFSKDLGIPADIPGAVELIAAGNTAQIDLAAVNGRIFINNSSIGLYPRIVRKREQQQRLGSGKWWAAFWAALRVFRVSRFLKVKLEIDGRTFVRKTPFLFVGNNEYEMDLYNIGRRERLDKGRLSVYFLRKGGRWGVIMLLLRTLTGTVRQWRDFEAVITSSVTIQTRRRRLPVALDGEVIVLDSPLEYKILPRVLKVIVPVTGE